MAESKKPTARSARRRRPVKNTFTTKSGNTIALHRSLTERYRAHREAQARRRAAYLGTLPKNRFKRILYRLRPRELARYWFSRDGAIMALKIIGVGIVVLFVAVVGTFAYFRKDLPNIKDFSVNGANAKASNVFLDRTDQTVLWQDNSPSHRVPVQDGQISTYIKEATVAVEDKDFYNHGAFDIRGIVRAGVHDAFGSGDTQGGSTITQQLVKLSEGYQNNRTIANKIKEVILGVELERENSKQDILAAYLNLAPYSPVDNGIQVASQDYFGVDAKDLTLAQAAMLAAIPRSPNDYSPYGPRYDQNLLLGRMDYVLDQMVAQKLITKAQATAAKQSNVIATVKPQSSSQYAGIKAPYFVLAAEQALTDQFGTATVSHGGLRVTTTLDLTLQTKAEQIVKNNLPNITSRTKGNADEEATVLENVPTGQIEALVGGVDFFNTDHGYDNYAAGILIPPGSSFKPYDYTTLIDNNTDVGAGSVIYDVAGPLPQRGYECTNKALPKNGGNCLADYDFLQPGPLTLRYALGGSRNIPAVKAMLMAVPNDTSDQKTASINKVLATATAMMDNPYIKGNTYNCYSDEALTQVKQCYGSAAIGDGAFLHLDDHVNGLATLARLGAAIPHAYILKVADINNKTIYQWEQPKSTQVIKQDSAYIVDNMASDPNASYLPGSCNATTLKCGSDGFRSQYKFQYDNGWRFAVKTGTTNNGFDGLMTSWSTQWAVVSWVGNHMRNQNLGVIGATMEELTEPITRPMMEAAHAGMKPVNWQQPSDIKVLSAWQVTRHVNHGDIEPSPKDELFPSWYVPPKNSTQTTTIDLVSGKTATACTPPLAVQKQTGGSENAFSIDIFFNASGSSTTPNGTDDVHNCGDATPSITVTQGICEDPTKCDFTVAVTQGTDPLTGTYITPPASTISLISNGQTLASQSIPAGTDSPYTTTFTAVTVSNGQAVTGQVIDSVLYSGSSDPITVSNH